MTVNKATLDLIVEFEGIRTEAYPDPAHGWSIPTIGIGHTSAAGPPVVVQGMQITKGEAYDILARDLDKYEDHVRRLVKVPLNDNQLGALTSFCFNLGPGNLAKSTLLRKLNARDYAGAANEFARWDKAGGKTLRGLTRRRAAEAALFRTPVSSAAPPILPDPPDIEPAEPIPTSTLPERSSGGLPWGWILLAVFIAAAVAVLMSNAGLSLFPQR